MKNRSFVYLTAMWYRRTNYFRLICRAALPKVLAALIFLAALPVMTMSQETANNQENPENLKQLSLADLGNVEVTTVSKEPEEVRKTPAAIFVLTQDDIRRSGATSIPEALRLIPGVEVARIDTNQWAVGIRGFGNGFSKSVLVLIDGRSVYTPLFEGVYWDVQNVMLEDVDRIEVIRGPGGTIWGANAVNGVINIITKSSEDTHGTLVSTGGGNVDQGTGEARYGGTIGKNFNYRMYGMGFIRGPEYHPDHDPFDPWRMGQFGFRTDWTVGDLDSFTFQGDIYSGKDGLRTGIGFFTPPSQANVDNTSFESGGNLLARWRHQLNGKSDIQLQAYFDRTNRQYLQLGETRNTFDIDFIHHWAALQRQDIIWGLGMRYSPSNFIQTQPTVNFLPHHEADSVYSGFLQDEISILENKLSLTVGSKFEHNSFSGFEIEPSVRLLWTPTPRQTFWASATRAVRTPSRLDQDLSLIGYAETIPPYPVFVEIAGNPKFSSEILVGYEGGYRALLATHFYLDVATFFNNYDNLSSIGAPTLSFQQSPPPSYTYILVTIPYVNGIKGNTDGIELAPNWNVTSWWQLKASYSYFEMHLRDKSGFSDPGTRTVDVGSSPHHQVVIQSLFNLPKKFEFDPTYRYVSALPAQGVKSYSTMDVRLGWQFAKQFEFSVVGQNLFQPFHAEFGNSPGPIIDVKRSAYVKITWRR